MQSRIDQNVRDARAIVLALNEIDAGHATLVYQFVKQPNGPTWITYESSAWKFVVVLEDGEWDHIHAAYALPSDGGKGGLFGAARTWNREWIATSPDASPLAGGVLPDLHWALFEWRPTELDNWGLGERGVIRRGGGS